MSHAFVTVIASVPVGRVKELRAQIEALGNPAAPKLGAALDQLALIHFASLNVFVASAGDRGHLVFEFSGDGEPDDLLSRLDVAIGAELAPIYAVAEGRGKETLAAFWRSRVVTTGQTPMDNPGLNFSGTPGLSVTRIRRERDLFRRIAAILAEIGPGRPALERLDEVRRRLRGDADWSWALNPEPLPEGGGAGTPEASAAIGALAGAALRDFLWPLAIPPVLAFVIAWLASGVVAGLVWAGVVAVVEVVGVLVLYARFRQQEDSEIPVDRFPDPQAVAAIMRRENHAEQNHLAALSVMKPGRLRRFTLTLAFWVIAQFATRFYRPGFLGSLGTIHFARWVMVPGTGDLLFLSNYGGSWESYLEDFITKAHAGLTGVWSNTVGFPRTTNLFQDGATDGERFKHWARRQQIPTAFWYTAYPDVTTANIRIAATARQGLGAAMTEDDAQRWLSLFGSDARPERALEASEIQSLVFGGLGFLGEGAALLFGLADDRAAAKAWLAEVLPEVAFSDGRRYAEATILGLAATALPKLGLPEDCLSTFPPAFLDGMAAPWRSRILGDVGDDAPETWSWGKRDDGIDGVLVVYAKSADALGRLREKLGAMLARHGHAVVRTVPFRSLPKKDASDVTKFQAKCEPFGFVDGLSQPVIRGTYKALRGADAIHLVEAGEFILGYPDNRGFLPPTPTLAAIHDPAAMLPVAAPAQSAFSGNIVNDARDLGRNGSFLAIRQLEQDVDGFWRYCEAEGRRLAPSFPPGVRGPAEEFVAAKIVGRWRDGSPLVRWPRYPASHAPVPPRPLMRAGQTAAELTAPSPRQVPPGPAPARRVAELAHRSQTVAAEPAGHNAASARPLERHEEKGAREKPDPAFEADNDFLLGTEDPQGLRCPFGAHIRRTNPRDSFDPGSNEQIDITNRHRIIRVGRFLDPAPGQPKGLFFMCLNGNIERQFEFVQQTWVQEPSFMGLSGERDPLIGHREGATHHSMPTAAGPVRMASLPTFVRTAGGGYFFLPGRRTLEYLAAARAT